jgi:hypothetical protein
MGRRRVQLSSLASAVHSDDPRQAASGRGSGRYWDGRPSSLSDAAWTVNETQEQAIVATCSELRQRAAAAWSQCIGGPPAPDMPSAAGGHQNAVPFSACAPARLFLDGLFSSTASSSSECRSSARQRVPSPTFHRADGDGVRARLELRHKRPPLRVQLPRRQTETAVRPSCGCGCGEGCSRRASACRRVPADRGDASSRFLVYSSHPRNTLNLGVGSRDGPMFCACRSRRLAQNCVKVG